MSAVIQTENLCKTYEAGLFSGQEVRALNNMNLEVEPGEIFAYLGPNGSGKTTTIKLLLSLIFPTAGKIAILGREDIESPDVQREIGYLPEGAYYPDFLRGEEVLRFYGQLYGLSGRDLEDRVDRVLGEVGMTYARKRLLRGYSKGMRQRIGLAQALLSDPQLLILDEPTTGLDPLARTEIRDILAGLRDAGKTLLISSHELLEVELISNRVAIIYKGEMQVQGTIDELLTDRDITIEAVGVEEAAAAPLRDGGIEVEEQAGGHSLLHVPNQMSLYDALERCRALNINIFRVAPRRETLEELFVRTVGVATTAEK